MPEVEDSPHQDDIVAAAREVATTAEAKYMGSVMLDLSTARSIVALADQLEPENLAKLRAMDVRRAAQMAKRMVSA